MKDRLFLTVLILIASVMGIIIGSVITMENLGYYDAHRFCELRQHKTFDSLELWVFENEPVFSVMCKSNTGLIVVGETFDVYNKIHNKPRG